MQPPALAPYLLRNPRRLPMPSFTHRARTHTTALFAGCLALAALPAAAQQVKASKKVSGTISKGGHAPPFSFPREASARSVAG